MKNKINKTTTLTATVAVTKTETGMDYVQVMPDNPSVGLVEPFVGRGRGQLLSNGSFDFTRIARTRSKPELKLEHSSLSFGSDGYDRYVMVIPSGQRAEFAKILKKEAPKAAKYLIEKGYSL